MEEARRTAVHRDDFAHQPLVRLIRRCTTILCQTEPWAQKTRPRWLLRTGVSLAWDDALPHRRLVPAVQAAAARQHCLLI